MIGLAIQKIKQLSAISEYNARAVAVLGYVAQFAPLPAAVWRMDVDNARRMFGFAPNSLEWKQYFGLGEIGFPAVISASAYCWATRIRAATKTVSCWKAVNELLILHSAEDVPCSAIRKGIFWGEHWDAPPFCVYLAEASRGIHELSSVTSATQSFLLPLAEPPLTQANVSKLLRRNKCFSDCNFCAVFKRRLNVNFPVLNDSSFVDAELPKVFAALRKCKPYIQTCVLKTFFNSWTTSDRMHGDHVLPCLFGCSDQKDILSHYLRCPTLWGPICRERNVVTCSWRDTLGFKMGKSDFIALARAFHIFHSAMHGSSKSKLLSLGESLRCPQTSSSSSSSSSSGRSSSSSSSTEIEKVSVGLQTAGHCQSTAHAVALSKINCIVAGLHKASASAVS
jgi:hypothetical protein